MCCSLTEAFIIECISPPVYFETLSDRSALGYGLLRSQLDCRTSLRFGNWLAIHFCVTEVHRVSMALEMLPLPRRFLLRPSILNVVTSFLRCVGDHAVYNTPAV